MATIGTLNDDAWEKLFDKYKILDCINSYGFFKIESKKINEFRESRLMAKFDHYINLPKLFKENKLSILPISRSEYLIGTFSSYFKVEYDHETENIPIPVPQHIESIDYNNIYSESAALHCASVTGIINDLMNEEALLTISGRMSSDSFNYSIRSSVDNSLFPINVGNSQIEIDAGFETKNNLLIIEAKNISVDDFLIRQLYYPYRLWSGKISKNIVPVFMTHSNDIFSFFIFQFNNPLEYNSLSLIKQKNYIIAPENISLQEIWRIFNDVNIIVEPKVPFPQADKFERIIDLLGLLVENDLSKNDITQNYEFDIRQTDYYTNALIYLDLVNKYNDLTTGEITYTLTDAGKSLLKKRYKFKYLSLVKLILQHKVFHQVLELYFHLGYPPSKVMVCDLMRQSNLYNVNSESTIERRSQTVTSWIDWILNLIND